MGQEVVLRKKRGIVAVLIFSLLLNAVFAYAMIAPAFNGPYAEDLNPYASQAVALSQQVEDLEDQLQTYHSEVGNLSKQVAELEKQGELLQKQVEYYRNQAEYYAELESSQPASEGLVGSATVNLVAVRTVPAGFFEVKYEGVTFQGVVELKPGQGRVLVNTEPIVGIDLQTSLRTAVQVAEGLLSAQLGATDIIVTVKAEEEVEIVDGPSAGAALTVGLIAAIEGNELNPYVYMTGTINPDGTIGPVGGIPEKAIAAAEKGAKTFIVPEGQSTVIVYEEEKKQVTPGFTIITTKPIKVGLEDLLHQRGYDIKVIENENVEQAYRLFVE